MVAHIVKSLAGLGGAWVPRDRSRESGWAATRSTTTARPTDIPADLLFRREIQKNHWEIQKKSLRNHARLPDPPTYPLTYSSSHSHFSTYFNTCYFNLMFISLCCWYWVTRYQDSLIGMFNISLLFENIFKGVLTNIDIDKELSENINIEKIILKNIDPRIWKISYWFSIYWKPLPSHGPYFPHFEFLCTEL